MRKCGIDHEVKAHDRASPIEYAANEQREDQRTRYSALCYCLANRTLAVVVLERFDLRRLPSGADAADATFLALSVNTEVEGVVPLEGPSLVAWVREDDADTDTDTDFFFLSVELLMACFSSFAFISFAKTWSYLTQFIRIMSMAYMTHRKTNGNHNDCFC